MTILVTGATGSVGRLVVDHLSAAGATNIRALTTNPGKAALPSEVEVVQGFIGRPASLGAALAGVERMYLAPHPLTAREVTELARAAGVEYIVDLSSSDADDEATRDPSQWWYYAVEHAVERSGVAWTHLRPGEFMTNTLDWAAQIRTTGVLRAPYGHASNTMIDLDDIAAVAATVLLQDTHIGKKYVLSGPQAIERVEQLRLIGAAIGRTLRWDEQQHDEALAELTKGMGDYAQHYIDYLAWSVEHPPTPSPEFATLTGRSGTTYAEWVRKHADAFR